MALKQSRRIKRVTKKDLSNADILAYAEREGYIEPNGYIDALYNLVYQWHKENPQPFLTAIQIDTSAIKDELPYCD